MSLPPELGTLCLQLVNTPSNALIRYLPDLLRQVQRCSNTLSKSVENATQADAPIAVQVHKLRTCLTSFLNGRVPEQRFVAVVLIKAVVEAGRWEILRASEPWVRGLLSLLAKSDCAATRELCVLTLCKIYSLTHQYPTLVRELTTPTLPTFITTCLTMVVPKTSSKNSDVPLSLIETIFCSFAALLPRHTTIFRPFVNQIRTAARPFLAPTSSDAFVTTSLKESSRRIVVLLHLTVPKSGGGEEWGKAIRDVVKHAHGTADQVFRAVVEDWESDAGYHGGSTDVSKDLVGGGSAEPDLPSWSGIGAGAQRLIGLLELLTEYLKNETSTPVTIPLGIVVDLITRMLSIQIPSSSTSSGFGETRLHPGVERIERDGLWTSMPQIYSAALQFVVVLADRIQTKFLSIAQGLLDQTSWIFQSGKHDPTFRLAAYQVTTKALLLVGPSLGREQSLKLSDISRSCCQDVYFLEQNGVESQAHGDEKLNANGKRPRSIHNADNILQGTSRPCATNIERGEDLITHASALLPLLISHIPQQYVHVAVRSLVEQTAVLAHHKDTMLAAILNPYAAKNGRIMTGMLPHITSQFPHDAQVELLLRPRMPLVPSTAHQFEQEEGAMNEMEDTDEDMAMDEIDQPERLHGHDKSLVDTEEILVSDTPGFPVTQPPLIVDSRMAASLAGPSTELETNDTFYLPPRPSNAETQPLIGDKVTEAEGDAESDQESLDLVMELDSDSE